MVVVFCEVVVRQVCCPCCQGCAVEVAVEANQKLVVVVPSLQVAAARAFGTIPAAQAAAWLASRHPKRPDIEICCRRGIEPKDQVGVPGFVVESSAARVDGSVLAGLE